MIRVKKITTAAKRAELPVETLSNVATPQGVEDISFGNA